MSCDVSYLVPSYNHEKFLIDTLDSIYLDCCSFQGTYEIILIDDGSIDSSKKVICRWIELHPEVNIQFKFRSNMGLAFTLQEMINSSNGKYIRLCSSDDSVIDGSTQILVSEAKRRNADYIFGNSIVIDDSGRIISNDSIKYHKGKIYHSMCQPELIKSLILNWCIAGPSLVIKKSFFKDFSYDSDKLIDDFHLLLSVIYSGKKIAYCNHLVSKYRVHDSNTSKTQNTTKRVKNLLCYLSTAQEFEKREGEYKKYISVVVSRTELKISFLKRNYSGFFKNFLDYLRKKLCLMF